MNIDLKRFVGIILLAVGLTGLTNLLTQYIPPSISPWITYGVAVVVGIYLSDGWKKQ